MSHGDSMRDEAGSNHPCRTASTVARAIRVVAGTLCLLVHGCDTVSGGAVELSWKLRPASSLVSDKFVDCYSGQPGTGTVTDIRLHWQVTGQDGSASGSAKSWACDDNHGVTGFELPEGMADLWVTPECRDSSGKEWEALPDTYIAPATVRRSVFRGDTVSLGAVELVVSVSYCRYADPLIPRSCPPADAGVPTDADQSTQSCICDCQ
jgi:hypothetical protein